MQRDQKYLIIKEKALMTTDKPRYIIVGGVAEGATAAARIRRMTEDAEIILFEKGQYISYANCGLPSKSFL